MSFTFKEYEKQAEKTAQFTHPDRVTYCVLALTGETGEIAEKRKKQLRGDANAVTNEELAKELGDVLWYLTMLAQELGTDIEAVAKMNIEKLHSRKERGVIKGSGDNR